MDYIPLMTAAGLLREVRIGDQSPSDRNHVAQAVGDHLPGQLRVVNTVAGDDRNADPLLDTAGQITEDTARDLCNDLRYLGFMPTDVDTEGIDTGCRQSHSVLLKFRTT